MIYKALDKKIEEHSDWSLRRQKGIPNNKRLWVLACMDERLPVEEALGIGPGDAHIFRNAGGLVTDDAVRSAMLSTHFFESKEIIVLNHTECGMMKTTGEALVAALNEKGLNLNNITIDPSLPELRLEAKDFANWIKTFSDVDEACILQVEYLKQSPFIPNDVVINGYIWEVENHRLRRPNKKLSDKVNSHSEMSS